MVSFLIIKLLFIVAIFSKAWLDAKGNKNQLDHIITGMYETVLIIAMVIIYYYGYQSNHGLGGYTIIISYICLRYAIFDNIYAELANHPNDGLDTDNNNILDRPKLWLRDISDKSKLPLLITSRVVALFIGLIA